MKKLLFVVIIFFIPSSLYALELTGAFNQGNLIIGKIKTGSKVFIDGGEVKVSDQGFFAFGLSKDRKNNVSIKIIRDSVTEKLTKKVYKKEYKIQRIDGLPKKQVTPPKEVYERIKNDNILIGKARSVNSDLDFFKKKFIKPINKAIITGVYGSQRILNGKPRRPHYGLDYAAKEGTPIKAMLDGTVNLSEKNLYFTGGTIIIDHGHGISTLYMHMKDVDVRKGQNVSQGDIIGTVGKTGRSTGPHLDVRLNWFDVKLDPALVLKNN